MFCRCCGKETNVVFVDLQASPAANSFLTRDDLSRAETYYPLKVFVCDACFLVQIDEMKDPAEIFNSEYVYFSSYSEAFVRHAQAYANDVIGQFGLNEDSFVIEAASNDGYLLKNFVEKNIPCLGVEPSASTAESAREKGVESLVEFFSTDLAKRIGEERQQADLFIGNNVIAHVPDLNDFIEGIATVLKPDGVAAIEFPHLLNLIREVQFDTIYHEHFSYFSLLAISKAFANHGMMVFKVDEVPVHGGSLRIFCSKVEAGRPVDDSVAKVLEDEKAAGLDQIDAYKSMQGKVDELCRNFLEFLVREKGKGKKIVGYGAAAKGNTLLNYCGVRPYLIDFVSDITPAKQGKFLPGTRIPVYSEEKLSEHKPDYIVIFPWNWKDAIRERLSYASEWGAKFVTVVPELLVED